VLCKYGIIESSLWHPTPSEEWRLVTKLDPNTKYVVATPNRQLEIDALRGFAALAVVLFHYTTRFVELFQPTAAPSLSFGYGYFGVNLFFIISGYVIFMTLSRTRRSMDFVVSRFSRLFPAYWVAIFLTLGITHWLGLPGLLVSLRDAIGNMVMLHSLLLRLPNVDGVYWTLEVELLFYIGMWLLYRLRALAKIHIALAGAMALSVLYALMAKFFQIDLPWIVYRILILQYIPWFALGIAIYMAIENSSPRARANALQIGALSIATLLIVGSTPWIALLATLLAATVWAAATGKLPFLRHSVFVWLGTITYPLYLLHQNIGYSLELAAIRYGWSPDMGLLAALAISLVMATALTYFVEKPMLTFIRRQYAKAYPRKQELHA
jgi:peptidoglycan/LPS O-acetylase OafA/YrhL